MSTILKAINSFDPTNSLFLDVDQKNQKLVEMTSNEWPEEVFNKVISFLSSSEFKEILNKEMVKISKLELFTRHIYKIDSNNPKILKIASIIFNHILERTRHPLAIDKSLIPLLLHLRYGTGVDLGILKNLSQVFSPHQLKELEAFAYWFEDAADLGEAFINDLITYKLPDLIKATMQLTAHIPAPSGKLMVLVEIKQCEISELNTFVSLLLKDVRTLTNNPLICYLLRLTRCFPQEKTPLIQSSIVSFLQLMDVSELRKSIEFFESLSKEDPEFIEFFQQIPFALEQIDEKHRHHHFIRLMHLIPTIEQTFSFAIVEKLMNVLSITQLDKYSDVIKKVHPSNRTHFIEHSTSIIKDTLDSPLDSLDYLRWFSRSYLEAGAYFICKFRGLTSSLSLRLNLMKMFLSISSKYREAFIRWGKLGIESIPPVIHYDFIRALLEIMLLLELNENHLNIETSIGYILEILKNEQTIKGEKLFFIKILREISLTYGLGVLCWGVSASRKGANRFETGSLLLLLREIPSNSTSMAFESSLILSKGITNESDIKLIVEALKKLSPVFRAEALDLTAKICDFDGDHESKVQVLNILSTLPKEEWMDIYHYAANVLEKDASSHLRVKNFELVSMIPSHYRENKTKTIDALIQAASKVRLANKMIQNMQFDLNLMNLMDDFECDISFFIPFFLKQTSLLQHMIKYRMEKIIEGIAFEKLNLKELNCLIDSFNPAQVEELLNQPIQFKNVKTSPIKVIMGGYTAFSQSTDAEFFIKGFVNDFIELIHPLTLAFLAQAKPYLFAPFLSSIKGVRQFVVSPFVQV